MPLTLSFRIDMRLIDREILRLISSRADAEGIARMTLPEIAAAVGCSKTTAYRATNRLQNAEHIKKTDMKRGGIIFEVLCL